MIKRLLILLILMTPLYLKAQDIERLIIQGQVTAPVETDVEGVNIYNVSSQKGVITDSDGNFSIEVAVNDRLMISALQFSSFTVIVDKGVIDNKRMGIYLNPVVNQLAEVIVRPYDLSGNVVVDVSLIKTANIIPKWDLSYEALEFGYEFSDDQYTSVKGNKAEEAFFNGQQQAQLNFVGLARLLFPKREKNSQGQINSQRKLIAKNLRQRFNNSYILDVFGISEENANDFIYFAEENGMEIDLLKPENEILLLDFMYQKKADYLKQAYSE